MKTLQLLIASSFLFFTSLGLAQDLAVYVSDAGNFNVGPWQIAKFDENGNFSGHLIETGDGLEWPQDIIFLDSEETVLISNLGNAGIISKHHWATGDFIENFAQGLGGPTRMKIGPDGLLYVLQWSNSINKVLRYNLNGTFVDEFTSIGIPQSIGIDWDSNGDLYVSSYGGSFINKFDGTNGSDLGHFIDSGLNGPTNIWFEDNDNLIVFDYNTGNIKRFDLSGVFIENVIAGLNSPEGYDFFPNGDILIGNGGDGSVKRYDSDFNSLGNFIEPGILNTPNAIVIRDDIPLSVTEHTAQAIHLTPTIGNKFIINKTAITVYDSLSIYSTTGKLIETIFLKETSIWDATSISDGVYFVVAEQKGKKATQKIIVSRE